MIDSYLPQHFVGLTVVCLGLERRLFVYMLLHWYLPAALHCLHRKVSVYSVCLSIYLLILFILCV